MRIRRWLCALLAAVMLCPAALAEDTLPVLVAQLGHGVNYVGTEETGDEYVESLETDECEIRMARLSGEVHANEAAARLFGEIREGEELAFQEGGVDERSVFLTGEEADADAVDATVIWMDGYTYAFACRTNAERYFDGQGGEPFSNQVDYWVDGLFVFDGDDFEDDGGELMLIYENPMESTASEPEYEDVENGYELITVAEDGAFLLREMYTVREGLSAEDAARLLDPALENFELIGRRETAEGDDLYPAYLCRWTTGANEDLRICDALIVVTDSCALGLEASVSADRQADYADAVTQMLEEAVVFDSGASEDGVDMLAEQVASCLFVTFEESEYLGVEEVSGFETDAYEYFDAQGNPLGCVAVSVYDNAMFAHRGGPGEAEYLPVQWDDTEEIWYIEEE